MSRNSSTIDGARKARLYDNVIEWSAAGLYMNDRRGEKKGCSKLPNLSTRPPRTRRNRSKKTSSSK